jgi:hypothetical protein
MSGTYANPKIGVLLLLRLYTIKPKVSLNEINVFASLRIVILVERRTILARIERTTFARFIHVRVCADWIRVEREPPLPKL